MKRTGKITEAHINEMMKAGDLDGDGWELTIIQANIFNYNSRKLTFDEFEKAMQAAWGITITQNVK